MKKNLIALAIAATAVLSAANASAAAGQVNFTGKILETGCDVVNTVASPLTVAMGQIAKSEFTAGNTLSAAQTFKIQLTNCPAAIPSARISFDGTPLNGDTSVLQLNADNGVATGVGIQISDTAGVLPLRQPSATYTLVSGSDMNDLAFTARYKAVGTAVTAGPANATANFSVIYN
ncbi:fimbrial protein [Buttiauxella izardii]|uniref:Type 1 fimbrial protein n=1 Tax=Buttiauxella izardii TaxID=82991 RepID=A0A3A5JZX0_9ENTR|nr:fimbrial protein [Buttiauxella izardii]RJT27977.1 type 1 fimbrial protein [Buttiauxella izardii]